MAYGISVYALAPYGVSVSPSVPVVQGVATVLLMACGAFLTVYASGAGVTVQAAQAQITLS